MVNVSTLVYVLENLEGKDEKLIKLEELLEKEEKYVRKVFSKLDQSNLQVRPGLIKNILKTASTF
jgi:hypothetical protein